MRGAPLQTREAAEVGQDELDARGRFTIRVERDTAPDAADHGGWKVTKYHRTGWTVVFRGDIAECQDFARGIVDDRRAFAERS